MILKRLLLPCFLAILGVAALGQIKPSLDYGAAMLSRNAEFMASLTEGNRIALAEVHVLLQQDLRVHGDTLYDNKSKGLSDAERIEWAETDKSKLYARFTNRVFKALTPEQGEQLRRLALRHNGPRMLRLPEVAKRIGLPETKRVAIDAKVKAFDNMTSVMLHEPTNQMMRSFNQRIRSGEKLGSSEIESLGAMTRKHYEVTRPKIDALKKKADAEVLASLSTEQRRAWQNAIKN